jgi:small redox-active disulfide protein 2
MDIKILGTGCKRCITLEQNVRNLVAVHNITANIEKVTDIQQIIAYGVMSTPGLVINGTVKSTGSIPKDDQILAWIKEA